MSETINACENICGDFSWLGAVAGIFADLGTFIVGLGVIAAFIQLRQWRAEAVSRTRSDAAAFCLTAIYAADDALRMIRNPLDRIPVDEAGDQKKYYERRYKRIVDKSDVFDELRNAQVKAKIFIGSNEVSSAIDSLFEIRRDVALAIEFTAEDYDAKGIEARELQIARRREMSGSYSEKDILGQKQILAVNTAEAELIPLARYERMGK